MNTINMPRDYHGQGSGEAQHLGQRCPRALLLPTTAVTNNEQPLSTREETSAPEALYVTLYSLT